MYTWAYVCVHVYVNVTSLYKCEPVRKEWPDITSMQTFLSLFPPFTPFSFSFFLFLHLRLSSPRPPPLSGRTTFVSDGRFDSTFPRTALHLASLHRALPSSRASSFTPGKNPAKWENEEKVHAGKKDITEQRNGLRDRFLVDARAIEPIGRGTRARTL